MRLVEFLIYLLEAHAQTLQRLAALLSEEGLIDLLESADDDEAAERATAGRSPFGRSEAEARNSLAGSKALTQLFGPPQAGDSSSPYSELEAFVHDLRLPPPLEFHLWAYPHYRTFVESSLDLNSRIAPGGDAGTALVDEAVARAQEWVRALPLAPDLGKRAEGASHVAWLRFRASVLKRIGRRPLGPVYG